MAVRREVIEPKNPALNVSRNFNLPHSPGIRAGEFIFISGMVAIDPAISFCSGCVGLPR